MAHSLVALAFSPPGEPPADLYNSAKAQHFTRPAPIARPLSERIRAGDESALEALFHEFYGRLIRIAAAYVDGDTAADVVAEVFENIWNGRADWKPEDVEAFLYRAVRNRALNTIRGTVRELTRRTIYEASRDASFEAVDLTDTDPRTIAVRLAVTELNPRQREFVVLRWQEGRSAAEIATLLGTTVRAVTSLQDRTLAMLRKRAPELLEQLGG